MEDTRFESDERNREPNKSPKDPSQQINTGGGAHVDGDVQAETFIGRDQITFEEETRYDVTGLPNPYLGLRSFTYNDRDAFAGRDRLIEESVEQIANPGEQRILTFITGASGSGKSSFAQAGLIPALEGYYQQRHKEVRRAFMSPATNPAATMNDALVQLGIPEMHQGALAQITSIEFNDYLNQHTSSEQVNLVVIDQFEELFTTSSPNGREFLIRIISSLSQFSEIRTHFIATMRSDYLNELFELKTLWDLARNGPELRAMGVQEMKEAIQKPLQIRAEHDKRYREKRITPGLVEKLAQDASEEAAYLPLLQVTLEELWRKNKLKLENYQGLTAAISQRADQVQQFDDYNDSDPQDERPESDRDEILNIFLDLVSVSLDDKPERDVRRSRTRQELETASPEREHLIEDLIQARLLSVYLETIGTEQVEYVNIIHDSLILNWQLLMGKIMQMRGKLKYRIRFEQEFSAWVSNDYADNYLLSGIHMSEAEELDGSGDIALQNESARKFYTDSIEKEQSRIRRSLFWRNLPAGSIGGGIGFGLAFFLLNLEYIFEAPFILISSALLLYPLIGLITVGFFTSLGITYAQILPEKYPLWVRWLVGGLGGVLGFSFALVIFSSIGNTVGENSIGLVILEGVLWGSAAGLGITWGMTSSRPIWMKTILIGFLGGLALTIGEVFGNSFWREQYLFNPDDWQIFLTGAVVPSLIFLALSFISRRVKLKDN
jgi:energy-coupling factor transporter ATP-binding protein EcfA2